MQEVTSQLDPLRKEVQEQGKTLRSLYRNGGVGAPGFLETAREIDNGRFDMIFKMLQEFKDAVKPVTKFMDDHKTAEEQKEKDSEIVARNLAIQVKSSESRAKRNLVILGLILGLIQLISANLQGCKNATKSFFSGGSQAKPVLSSPQNSQVSQDSHPEGAR